MDSGNLPSLHCRRSPGGSSTANVCGIICAAPSPTMAEPTDSAAQEANPPEPMAQAVPSRQTTKTSQAPASGATPTAGTGKEATPPTGLPAWKACPSSGGTTAGSCVRTTDRRARRRIAAPWPSVKRRQSLPGRPLPGCRLPFAALAEGRPAKRSLFFRTGGSENEKWE